VWLEYQVAEQIDSPGDLAPYDALLAAAVAKDGAWAAALARELQQAGLSQRTPEGLRVAGCPALEAALRQAEAGIVRECRTKEHGVQAKRLSLPLEA
jgi:hypothetical protein